MDSEFLFVYGTLRRGADTAQARRLVLAAEYIGIGAVSGALYAVGGGSYPGLAVQSAGQTASEVVGDLYHTGGDADLLRWLDDYEGIPLDGTPGEYQRIILPVHLPGRPEPVRAWAYAYLPPCHLARRIASGDWLNRTSP